MPKGALLRHGNIMATVACVPYLVRLSGERAPFDASPAWVIGPCALPVSERCVVLPCCACAEQDLHVSYLPLAHIFETVIQVAFLVHGAQIGFFQGNVKKLTSACYVRLLSAACGGHRRRCVLL